MRVPWSERSTTALYEDMVSVLIKRLYPDAMRIDGSGGDGGRDLQIHTDAGLVIFELKSFTGRLNTGDRKRQIAKSLTRATEHRPVRWHLVAPIDLSPSELDWFEKLVANNKVAGEWLGLTWLDSEMSQRPEIQRYFLDGYNDEVVRLLRELKSEDLELDDSMQAMQRARTIRRQLNECDPYFRYDLTIGNSGPQGPRPGVALSVSTGTDRIDVIPRYRTALSDRPISVTADLDFSGDHSGHLQAFENAVRFGDPVTLPSQVVKRLQLDAPAGLSQDVEGAEIRLAASDLPLGEIQLVHLAVLAPDSETRLAIQEFEVTHRRAGSDGGTLTGKDASGILSVSIRMDRTKRSLSLNVSTKQIPVLPAVGLGIAQWIEEVRPPNLLALEFVGREGDSEPVPIEKPMAEGSIVPLLEAFAELQVRAGVSFPVPVDLTVEEWAAVSQAAAWLSPEKVQYTWTHQDMTITPTNTKALRDLFRPEGGNLMITMDVSLEFRDRQLQLGRLARTFQAKALGGQQALDDAIARGDNEMHIRFEPAGSDVAYEWLMTPEEIPS